MPFLVGYITPQDFGAVGNGTNDDTAAIQAALNAVSANGSTVFFPTGTYKITATLTASVTGTEIQGNGWGSQIQFDGNTVTTALNASGNIRLHIRDIRISNTNASHLGTALDLSQTNGGVTERVLIDGGGGSGVAPLRGIFLNAATCLDNTIRNCRINYGGATSFGINISGSSNSTTIQDVRLVPQGDNSASSAIYVTNSTNTTIIKPHVESAAGYGIQLDTGAHGTSVNRLSSIANNVGLLIASGVVGTTVTGSTITTSTTANVQDNGTATQIFNAWPNSGATTYNHLSLPNTDQFLINGISVPGNDYRPSDHGYVTWDYANTAAVNSSATVNGTVHLFQVELRYATTLSKVAVNVATNGSGITANQNFLGVYDSGGTRRLVTAAGGIDAGLAASGALLANFTGSYAAPAGFYWIAIVSNATTPPQLARANGNISAANFGLVTATLRFATNGTGQTTLPASITPASNSTTNAITFWGALG